MQANAATALIYYSLLLNNINQYRLQYIAFFFSRYYATKNKNVPPSPLFTPQIIK